MTYVEQHMRESLKDHILEPVETGGKVQAFYLKKPGTRSMSTLILFTPEGIVLQGDLTPTDHGTVSALSYGIEWFASDLTESYLCGKFLQRKFRVDLIQENMRKMILSDRRERLTTRTQARAQWDEIPDGDEQDGRIFYDYWVEDMNQEPADFPAYGFDLGEAGWLCAIQQRFAALFPGLPAAE